MNDILREMRNTMLQISALGHDGNLQSCFSSLEILWTLYNCVLPTTKEGLADVNRNRFVLSKGQSNLALMTVLAKKGCLQKEELESFCKFESRISMQADRTKFDAIIETSAGSLGHGFPIAAGMAWGKKIQGTAGRVYCLAGDGEMNEGTMWEAALFAASEKLNNLVLIVDDNHSINRMLDIGDLKAKLEQFGFETVKVDGHDIVALEEAFRRVTDKPYAILAQTKRGWGCKTLMEDRSWFHRYPKGEELEMLCKEVEAF